MQLSSTGSFLRRSWFTFAQWHGRVPFRVRRGFYVVAILMALNFWPCIILDSPHMTTVESAHFVVHSEAEDRREAIQLKTMLEDSYLDTVDTLGLKPRRKEKFDVYLYPDIAAFQMRRWGVVSILLVENRYVSDMRGASLLVASPRRPGLFLNIDQVLDQARNLFVSRVPEIVDR